MRVVSVSDSIEVSRCVRNVSRHSIKVSCRVRNGINMVAMPNVIGVCRGMRHVPWSRQVVSLRVPRVPGTNRRMWNSVNMRCRMRYGVNMIAMADIVGMCRRMWDVMVMRVLVVALGACQLSHSKYCNCCDYDGARFQHFILPNRKFDFFDELPGGGSLFAQSFGELICHIASTMPKEVLPKTLGKT